MTQSYRQNRLGIYPLGRGLNTSQACRSAGRKTSILPVVGHLTVFFLEGATQLSRYGTLVTDFKEAALLSGWLGAFTLLLWEFGLRLCECEEHPTPHLTHLNARPTRGAAGRPGFWDEPEKHQKAGERSHVGHMRNAMVLMTVSYVVHVF